MNELNVSDSAKIGRKPVVIVDVQSATLTKAGDIYAAEERRRRQKAFNRAMARASTSIS